jgi:hypothetical protein
MEINQTGGIEILPRLVPMVATGAARCARCGGIRRVARGEYSLHPHRHRILHRRAETQSIRILFQVSQVS